MGAALFAQRASLSSSKQHGGSRRWQAVPWAGQRLLLGKGIAPLRAASFLLPPVLFCSAPLPEKEESKITQEIQAIIRQITASVTFLPLLQDTCEHRQVSSRRGPLHSNFALPPP